MAKVNVLRTNGKDAEMVKELDNKVIHVFLTDLCNENIEGKHDLGDMLTNEESDTRYALLVKEFAGDKIQLSTIRVALIRLLRTIVEKDIVSNTIVISKYNFSSKKEEISFIDTINEYLLIYFSELITEDIDVVITDYNE